MKISLSLKSVLLAVLFILSSCATTKYSDDVSQNNYTNLKTGKPYSFKLKASNKRQRMIFSYIKGDDLVGFKSKSDSTVITIPKASVSEARDVRKSTLGTAAIAIGAAGTAAIILSSTRATSN